MAQHTQSNDIGPSFTPGTANSKEKRKTTKTPARKKRDGPEGHLDQAAYYALIWSPNYDVPLRFFGVYSIQYALICACLCVYAYTEYLCTESPKQ